LQVGQVFEPFQRCASGLTNEKGIGLGLSIAKTLVEKMDGTIVVDSTLGQGSVFAFEITFDLASTRLEASSMLLAHQQHDIPFITTKSGTRESNNLPLRFLVVDDNAINMKLFERTVNHLFKQQKRAKPVMIFAANGE
jgi:hypothetical protein